MNQEDYRRIEEYLKKRLSPREEQAFEARLRQDSDLAAEVEWQQEMMEFLRRQADREALKAKLSAIGDKYLEPEPSRKTTGAKIFRIGRRPWLVAASVAVLITATMLVFLLTDSRTLYQQYSQHPSLSLTEMSTQTGYDLAAAEQAFNNGDYPVAERELAEYLTQNPSDTLALLYRGISLLELGRIQPAREIFEAIRNGSSDLKDLGTWYLALSYVKENDRENARQVLEQLPQRSERYSSARELLKKLQ